MTGRLRRELARAHLIFTHFIREACARLDRKAVSRAIRRRRIDTTIGGRKKAVHSSHHLYSCCRLHNNAANGASSPSNIARICRASERLEGTERTEINSNATSRRLTRDGGDIRSTAFARFVIRRAGDKMLFPNQSRSIATK